MAQLNERSIKLDGDVLECPDCGGGGCSLHQQDVRVMVRYIEDGDGVIAAVSSKGRASLSYARPRDIPGRRDVIEIDFSCESCGPGVPPKTLRIMQHKGLTLITWVHPQPKLQGPI